MGTRFPHFLCCGPDYKVLCRLCEVLDCQPGELMEYVTDEELERRTREEKKD